MALLLETIEIRAHRKVCELLARSKLAYQSLDREMLRAVCKHERKSIVHTVCATTIP
jgi:hypothetical protein